MRTSPVRSILLLFSLAVMLPWGALFAGDFDGVWCGEADIEGTSVFVQIDLKPPGEDGQRTAVVTIPMVGAYGMVAGEVRTVEDDLVIEVVDNGRGIDADITGSGLTNLRRRAEELGGSFAVVASADGGTCLTWRAPLP